MSEWHVQVIQLGKIGKHPNADTLSITQVKGHYPVIIKTGTFQQGDLAVHVPPDSLVPTARPEFAFLEEKSTNGIFRVRFSKLRGVPSYGFLVPPQPGMVHGQVVHDSYGITKYEPKEAYQMENQGDMYSFPGEAVIPHYDIEGLRKYENLFTENEPVWVSEKLHGSNGRWAYLDGELRCGSRTKFRRNSTWNNMAEKYGLSGILSKNEGLVLYGEVLGPGIQDLTYGLLSPEVRFFDIFDMKKGVWWDQGDFREWCNEYGLPVVPTLYYGPFNLDMCYGLAEGVTTMGGGHVREGIVVKPERERWDQRMGRVFLKLPGEGYLLRKGG